ncbi:hypothetical protein Moror_13098 [Moniliophthora roreri MCA 2997]|uniref:DUF6535 domain-containing protein n=2 Tax=Moniliophthora roreri TaxID=221103 RepID=V2XLR4_MONRO|nr:hypothetical protein Moror_13098 [Moniliophthora roreri MCA 2997]KAI3604507.1 hypothetical protein WG66_008264 [Moniliophthora roreri]
MFTDEVPGAAMPQQHTAAKSVDEKKRPTLDESSEMLLKAVGRYDEDLVKNWRDDIDTLLVFAGLFSAVVTAFLIESYQWLSEDPADTTVILLTRISMQLNGSTSISEQAPFESDPSSIRINCFWFLSLIFSLTSALFGLLCKQWVREHQRDTQTRTPGQALALRQLRRESFEKWGVSSFLSALPILLEIALLLFFVGVLDLLWDLNHIPFAVCFVAVALSAGLYFTTTLLPTVAVLGNQLMAVGDPDALSYQFICPYKSPQAWGIYQFCCKLLYPFLKIRFIYSFLQEHAQGLYDHVKNPAADWSSFDLRVVRRFDKHPSLFWSSHSANLKLYELRALQWAVTMFQDSPLMLPHLQNVLETIPPSVVMSAVFGRWNTSMWENVTNSDVELRLSSPEAFAESRLEGLNRYIGRAPLPTIADPALHDPEGIRMLFCHQYWIARASGPDLSQSLDFLFNSITTQHTILQQSTGLRFVLPFPVVDSLWTHQDPYVRQRSLELLSFFEGAWNAHSGYDKLQHDRERLALVLALSRHLTRTDRTSELLTSERGHSFIRFIHEQIISRRLYQPSVVGFSPRYILMSEWTKAINRTREVGNLPSDDFSPIPNPSEDLSPSLAHVARNWGFHHAETPSLSRFGHSSINRNTGAENETNEDPRGDDLDLMERGGLS